MNRLLLKRRNMPMTRMDLGRAKEKLRAAMYYDAQKTAAVLKKDVA